MAKQTFTPIEEGTSAPEAFAEAPPVALAPDAAAASSNEPPASSDEQRSSRVPPLKPGVRKITLAQARAHHAKA